VQYRVPGPGEPDRAQVNRGGVFSTLTGRRGADVSGTGNSVAALFRSLGVREDPATKRIDTADAAKAAGVSRSTVRRWLRGERRGEPPPARSRALSGLRTKARQAASTK